MGKLIFQLTELHISLAKNMRFIWSGDEWGGPTVDSKRPYGNSDMVKSICEIAGWDYEGSNEALYWRCVDAHYQMLVAIEIIVQQCFDEVRPGVYRKDESGDWRWVGV